MRWRHRPRIRRMRLGRVRRWQRHSRVRGSGAAANAARATPRTNQVDCRVWRRRGLPQRRRLRNDLRSGRTARFRC